MAGHPGVEDQQRRPIPPTAPPCGGARRVDDVRRSRHQHVHQFHQPVAVVAGHRDEAPRDLGQPGAGRNEQRRARRGSGVDKQLPGVGRDQMGPQRARDREFRCRRGEGAPGDRALEGVAPILGADGIRQRVGQLCQCRAEFGLIDHPVHGSGRLTDHAQAGVGGDSDVGEPQNQGGRLGVRHGHVAQVAPAAVTSRPYRSRASVR